jgi:ribonucleoside-triphosphate reductase
MAPTTTHLKRQECEIYSRVCGYMRPISQWNDAKQAEWYDRKTFKTDGIII